jgi:hypothetical protein
MAVSAETQAIMDTLTVEGEATRAVVNVKLERLEGILSTVSNNIAMQTQILTGQVEVAAEAMEQQKVANEKASVKQNEETSKVTNEAKKERVNLLKTVKNTSGEMFKGLLNTLTNIAIGGVALTAFAGLATGVFDSLTGGGFTKFTKDIFGGDWAGIRENLDNGSYGFSDGMNKLATFALRLAPGGDLNVSVNNFIDSLTKVTNFLLENPLLSMGLVVGGMVALRGATRFLTRGLMRMSGRLIAGGIAGLATAFGLKPPKASDLTPNKTPTPGPDDLDPRGKTQLGPDGKPKGPSVQTEVDQPKQRKFTVDANGKFYGSDGKELKGAALSNAQRTYNADQAKLAQAAVPDKAPVVDTTVTPKAQQVGRSLGRGGPKPGDLGKEIAKRSAGKVAKSVAKKVGAAMLKAIPVVGAAVGAWFAITSLARGDTTTAALEGTSIFLPSLSGAPVDLLAIATGVFFDVYGETYDPSNPEHREMMKAIGEMIEQEMEKYKNERDADRRTAYDNADAETRAAFMSQAEIAQMGPGGITAGMARVGGVTVRTARPGFFGGYPSASDNAAFFEEMRQGENYAGSPANLAARAARAAAGGSGSGTYNDNRTTNNVVQGGANVSNKTENQAAVFGSGGASDRTGNPFGLPGTIQ